MKRIYSILALILLLPCMIFAQDARQRTPQTIVADVLAEIPYAQRADFDTAMSDLLSTGSYGVTNLASMLVPAAEGQNNRVEYALDGLVAYATGHATPAQLAAVCEGLDAAINSCTDTPNKVFLLSLLTRISRPADAAVFCRYLDDKDLAEPATSGLISTTGTDDVVLQLVNAGKLPKAQLARMAGAKALTAAEPTLLEWLKTANETDATSIYKALAKLGTVKSLPVLAKAAEKENYQWLPTDATAAYVDLLNRLATDKASAKNVAKSARTLLKKAKDSHVRSGAMDAVFAADGIAATPDLYKAVTDKDRKYRVAALRACQPWANDAVFARLGEIAVAKNTPAQAKTDIVNWLGTNKVAGQIDAVIANITADDNELAEAAITAASRIGGEKALAALVGQLEGSRDAQATKALLSFNGKVNDSVLAALADGNGNATRANALAIAAARKIKAAAPTAFNLLGSDDATLSAAAYAALPGVVSASDIKQICSLMEKAQADQLTALQAALVAALNQVPAEGKYAAIEPYMTASAKPQIYYNALATTGTDQAIETLKAAYAQPTTSKAAFDALLTVDSPAMIDALYEIAASNTDANAAALKRYTAMVDKYGENPVRRYQLYRRALEASKSADIDNILLARLANTGTYQALLIADNYIEKPANAQAAAQAIRTIMSKNIDRYQGDEVRAALVKAADVFKAQKGNADAGYAVDDINGMLAKLDAKAVQAVAPTSALTPEEKAQGFEMLFDGTDMYKWTGDTATYILRDGCITVNAAHWGNNIYTVDEYGDFVFRFEFSLDRPGVNNGVGIRTPMGVDAAFHGMEIQILDHDDPMYAKLAPYQVHGSVYGVIPAKRVKFKLGQWNTEEIRAEGDHITVTVNGEVILDGNIREACQGHAVGDPGEKGNHYMLDHRNHPGLFNKSGHIGFLGHGDGIRFRNVRVLDLNRNK